MKTKTELIKFNQGLDLESGARLNTFDLMVETYGELNKDKDNAILAPRHAAWLHELEFTGSQE